MKTDFEKRETKDKKVGRGRRSWSISRCCTYPVQFCVEGIKRIERQSKRMSKKKQNKMQGQRDRDNKFATFSNVILFFASYCFGPTSRAHCIRMRFKGKQDEFFYKKRETGHVETGQPTKPNPTRISSNSHKNEMCRRYKAAFHNFVITIHTLIHTRKKKKSVVLRRIKKKKIFTPPRTNKDQQVFTKDDGRGLKLW